MNEIYKVWFDENGGLYSAPITNFYQENTMQEKLVPFNLEEAKKNPERVRWAHRQKPDDVLFPAGAVEVWEQGAAHYYPKASTQAERLRLVAVPKTKQYRAVITERGRVFVTSEHMWEEAEARGDLQRGKEKVRDVSFDKTTGIIAVTYDE